MRHMPVRHVPFAVQMYKAKAAGHKIPAKACERGLDNEI